MKKTTYAILITILVLLVILIGMGVYFIVNIQELKNGINQNNSNENSSLEKAEQVENINEIIKSTKYITISILDSEAQELVYTEPLKITDKETIEELRKYFNNSEFYDSEKEWKENGTWPELEGVPIVKFYFEDGTFINVMGTTFEELIGPVIFISNKDDLSDKVSYKLNNKDINLDEYIEEIYKENI